MRIFQVDAFADRPFGGNPAGVCVVGPDADAEWMQAVAAEMNVSETAFLVPLEDGGGRYGLRWFTPAVEVDLCGHATLASAHLLWEEGEKAEVLEFETRSGVLTAVPAGDELIQLDFPADPVDDIPPPDGLGRALGAEPVGVYRGREDVLVEVADAHAVRRLTPDFPTLASIPARGVIVTAAGDGHDGADFVSRCFYPAVGIDEDPVTGSAHCTLASFWCARLARPSLVGWQASRRGGRVGVELSGDRVLLTGRAVTVLRGDLVV
ncbi:MAG TPA: PhzF family phenazine biosynthesis isomerase [Acidimicrobiia bacterium]|nr:PhzF family phenazine biosynthesis isomerase [Acidimicrobiia bacterium]